jgi:cytosine/adenosine deaminase-related metal-dependent hydrolase
MAADLLVRNARVPDRKGLVDLAVDDGRFLRIEPDLDLDADLTIDAAARLVTAPLVDCHLHLDASLSAGRPRYNGSGTLIEGIHIWGELKGSLTVDDVLERARRVVKWSVAHGTLAIRAHADVSGENDAPLRGLLAVRDELADLVTIQVTAFPQDGIYTDPADEARLEHALRLGADCVGGTRNRRPRSSACGRFTGYSSSRGRTGAESTSTATRPTTRAPASSRSWPTTRSGSGSQAASPRATAPLWGRTSPTTPTSCTASSAGRG